MTPEEQDAAMIVAQQQIDQVTAGLRVWAPLFAEVERALIDAGVSEAAAAIFIGNYLTQLLPTSQP